MAKKQAKITLMVSSSVYGFEENLEKIYAVLTQLGYEVWMSYKGSIPTSPQNSAFEDCLQAVQDCDIFFCILRAQYGSGKDSRDADSITHRELKKAIELNKPRWGVVHHHVPLARQLFRQYMYDKDGARDHTFKYKGTKVLDNLKVIDMYNEAIGDHLPIPERKANWVQSFKNIDDILLYLDVNFRNLDKIRGIVDDMKGGER